MIIVFGLGSRGLSLGLGRRIVVGRLSSASPDAISELAKTIIAGDIQHRMPVAGPKTNSTSLRHLNRMLDRIEGLVKISAKSRATSPTTSHAAIATAQPARGRKGDRADGRGRPIRE